MKFLNTIPWEKWKPRVEVIAILGAAIFALFTWGFDAWRLSSPNWAVSFGETSELTGIVDNDLFKICNTPDCEEATACMVQSKVITKNEARTPLDVGSTTLSFYSLEKADASGFVNQSSYQLFTLTCSYFKNSNCLQPFEEIQVGQVDKQALFPGQEAWRPFTVEFHPLLMKEQKSLNLFAESNVILIVAKQEVSPKSLVPFQSPKKSLATLMLSNLCNRSRYIPIEQHKSDSIETIKVILSDENA